MTDTAPQITKQLLEHRRDWAEGLMMYYQAIRDFAVELLAIERREKAVKPAPPDTIEGLTKELQNKMFVHPRLPWNTLYQIVRRAYEAGASSVREKE